MSFYSNKEKMDDYKDICRNHSAKADREMYRVCPSKLSKRELEDLYFTLLENNLELKKTINGQQDKIRVLSTQVQRMTNTQEKLVSKEMKDRGTVTKAVVDEQKDFITELKETNQRLSDRIHLLNMRLCSAKQFMKTTPQQAAASRGNRSTVTAASTPKKHDCLSKAPESPEQVLKVSTFSQWEESTPRKANPTQIGVSIGKSPVRSDQPCDENKCRTLMEELKLKIATLQDELTNVHGEYATRIGRLETEVLEVRKENIRVLSERSASEYELSDTCKRASDILAQYRIFEAKCAELTTELAIERRKVAELETRLKAANMADKVNKTIEDHLTTNQGTSGASEGGRKDGSPAKDGTSDGTSQSIYTQVRSFLMGDPPDDIPRDSKPRNGGPDSGSKDGIREGGITKDVITKDGITKNGITKDGITKDGITKDAITKDGITNDGITKDGITKDGITKDGITKDGITKDGITKDGITKDGITKDGIIKDGITKDGIPEAGIPKTAGPQDSTDSKSSKCICGCLPPAPLPLPPLPAPAVNEKAQVKSLPSILPLKKRDGLEDTSTKDSPTKDSVISSSTGSKYSSSFRSYPTTTTTSEDTNCESCGCKFQLMSAVQSRTCAGQVYYYPVPAAVLNGKCTMCGYTPPASTATSTPNKDKKNNVDCRCPPCVQEPSPKCMKCCFNDQLQSRGSPPVITAAPPSTTGATSDRADRSTTNTADDSGYQDTDEQSLLKQNRELMAKILELQRLVDCMKIGGVCGMPGCSSENISGFVQSPTKTTDDNSAVTSLPPLLEELPKASKLQEDKPSRPTSPDTNEPVNSPPLLGETSNAEIPVEQIEKSLIDENYECIKPVPSEDHAVHQPRKILRIEVLGSPEEKAEAVTEDDTRAKTVEDAYGAQYIADDPVPDKYGYPDIPNTEFKRHRWDSPKFQIVEKKKGEGSIGTLGKHEPGNISLKSGMSSGPGPGFNPEKLKYLEAEGLTADIPHLRKRESLESVPSNPELGFGIPRLASKGSCDKYKSEAESGLAKKSLSTSISNVREPAMLRLPAHTDEENKDKEDCEYCTACSFDKECSHTIKPTMDKLALGIQKELAKKDDQQNSNKIPDPTVSSDNGKKEKKMNLFSHFKKQKKEGSPGEDLVLDPKVYAKKTSDTVDGAINIPDVPLLENRDKSVTDYMLSKGSDTMQKLQEKKGKSRKRTKIGRSKEDLKAFAQQTCETAGGVAKMADVPLLSCKEGPGKDSQEVKADAKQKLPEKAVQVPGYKDSSWQSDVSPYRRRSGTYCFRSRPQRHSPPACRCVGQQAGSCSHVPKSKGTQAVETKEKLSPREKRRATPTSDRGTYTVNSKQTDTSPDNTDLEMSYLSDLPMEKEKKSPLKSRPLSPGETRTTPYTSTLSSQSPPTNYSFSEGEMRPSNTKARHSEPDRDRPYLNAQLAHKLETPPSQQMEAALQAITDELQRCKNLLHRQRPAEPMRESVSAQTSVTDTSRPIALKPGVATQGIGDARAPVSVFTLHIGTVVFSDEAVLSSRGKNLVLKWKFYDQAVTMARMRAGRVMLFDFSTEYDVKVTDNFLNYLKYAQMPILICEIDQEDQPFASCALPLRDALLHTNTRADMSIALVAGPRMLGARDGVTDDLDSRDEIGVIDLWCMLRIEDNTVPGINLAIAKPGAAPMTKEERQSSVAQGADDLNELELTMVRSGPAATHEQTGKNQTYSDVGYNRPSDTWGAQARVRPAPESESTNPMSVGAAREGIGYDPSKYPPLRKRKSSQLSRQLPQQKTQVSEMIINEVNPMIKTPEDIKYALDKSPRLNDSMARIGRLDDEVLSQAHSSYSSLKSVLSRLQKRGSRPTETQGGDQRSFIEKLRKASKAGHQPSKQGANEAADTELYKKYENIAKIIGPTRTDQSKKVTIQPEYFESDVEKPQKDVEKEQTVNEAQTRLTPKLEITVLWLALNEECEAMLDPRVQRVYVAYSFLGRSGADLETPVSLPKPKHYVEKCYFNFKKVFELEDADFPKLGHMARCRSNSVGASSRTMERDCIVFSVVSEPAEDPLGIESCEDIGYAYLYLGDLLAYSAGSPGYTEVVPVRAARGAAAVCGVLAVRLDGLHVVRRCLLLSGAEKSSRSLST